MRGKRLRALPIAWHNLLTDVSGTPLQIRVGQSGHHSSVEPGNHVGRRALRRPDAAPGRHIKPLSLSDDQMTAILCATEPLPPGSRVAIPQKRGRRIEQAPGDRRQRSTSSPTERSGGHAPASLCAHLFCQQALPAHIVTWPLTSL